MHHGLFDLTAQLVACNPAEMTPTWLAMGLKAGVALLAPVVVLMTVQCISRAVANRQAARGPIFPV
jgi:hypothetical protein